MLKKIFSVKNIYSNGTCHKQITVLGIKIKLTNNKYEIKKLKDEIYKLSKETKLLRIIIDKSIDITKCPPARGNMRKIQLIKTEILKVATSILNKNKINYWLDYGTLIGAIRHKGFIPWDDDIDICVLKKDYVKLPDIFAKAFKDSGFYIDLGCPGGSEIIRICYKDLCIDIFPMEFLNQNYQTENDKNEFIKKWFDIKNLLLKKYPINLFKERKLNHFDIMDDVDNFKNEVFNCKYCASEESKQVIRSIETMTVATRCGIFDIDDIFPLKEAEFEGYTFSIPKNPIEHLYQTKEYGELGAVMEFPSINDSGYFHMFNTHNYSATELNSIYEEVVNLKTTICDELID